MARRKEESYVFDASARTVKIPGHINLNDILSIINVTSGVVIYSFGDPGKGATRAHAHPQLGEDPDFPWSIDGTCTFTLDYDTTAMSDDDELLILVEDERKGLTVRPYEAAVDSIERIKVSQGEALIDADFEYGLQDSKWQNVGFNSNYPSFSEGTGNPLVLEGAGSLITTNGATPSIITVNVAPGTALPAGTPFSISGLVDGAELAEGVYIVRTSNGSTQFSYTAKDQVTGTDLSTPYTVIRESAIFDQAGLAISSYTTDGTSTVTVTFSEPHGLFPGSPFILEDDNGEVAAEGPYFVGTVINSLQFSYDAGVSIPSSTVSNNLQLYAISNATFTHRPFDGGVYMSTFYPIAGLEAKRQTKRYFRYQSGKGINFSTGTLFSPTYNIQAINYDGTSITVTTELPHGFQPGVKVAISGVETAGYNSDNTDYIYATPYTVSSISSETVFVITNFGAGLENDGLDAGIPGGAADLGIEPKVVATSWKGSAVRCGMYDDANGAFWEFDGQKLYAVLRNSTTQITGTITATSGSNEIVGVGTRFGEQFAAGNKLVIKGQVYEVTDVESSTVLHINPAYRGVATTNSRAGLIRELRVPSDQFNVDTIDGQGPSGYYLHLDRIQMMGIQWSWYGAGFIDFQVRGPLGEWITTHRMANSNFQTEAYMRSGNIPSRYEIVTSCRHSKVITSSTGTGTGAITVKNASKIFPNDGGLLVIKSLQTGNILSELVEYDSITGDSINLTARGTSYSRFINGATKTFSGAAAQDHPVNSSVQFIGSNIAPSISHWGSSVLMDGGFDEDPGFRFTASRFNVTVAAGATEPVLVFRPAPAVSNTLSGEVGERELINRSRVQLQSIEINNVDESGPTPSFDPRRLEIAGVLNPSNYDPTLITWEDANTIEYGQGGLSTAYQPSFSQYSISEATDPQGGELLFKFITSEATQSFDISQVKELQNSILGGNGLFPNGPELIAFTITNRSTEATAVDIVISWKEAQA